MSTKEKKYFTLSDIKNMMLNVSLYGESLDSILPYFNIPVISDQEYEIIEIDPDNMKIKLQNKTTDQILIGKIGFGEGTMSGFSTTTISHLQTQYDKLTTEDTYYFLGRKDPVIQELCVESPKFGKKIIVSIEERPNVQGGTEKIAIVKLVNASTNNTLFEQKYIVNQNEQKTLYSFISGKSLNYEDYGWQQSGNCKVALNSQFAGLADSSILSISGNRTTLIEEIYLSVKDHVIISREEIDMLLSLFTDNVILVKVRDNDGVFHIVLLSICNDEYPNCSQIDYIDLMDPNKTEHNVIVSGIANKSYKEIIAEVAIRIEEDLSSPTNFLISDRLGRLVKLLGDSHCSDKYCLSPQLVTSMPFEQSIDMIIKNQESYFRAMMDTYIQHFDGDVASSDDVLKLQLSHK